MLNTILEPGNSFWTHLQSFGVYFAQRMRDLFTVQRNVCETCENVCAYKKRIDICEPARAERTPAVAFSTCSRCSQRLAFWNTSETWSRWQYQDRRSRPWGSCSGSSLGTWDHLSFRFAKWPLPFDDLALGAAFEVEIPCADRQEKVTIN